MVKVAGDAQTAGVTTTLPIAPSVKLTDSFGNAVTSAAVGFAPATGSGSVTGSPASANSSGIATVGSWTLGSTVGTQTLTATSGTVSVQFTATGTSTDPCLNVTSLSLTGGAV